MRIVHYYPRATVGDGGVTNAMWAWCEALRARGYSVAVIYDQALRGSRRCPGVELLPVRHIGRSPGRIPIGLGHVLLPDDVLVMHSSFGACNYAAALAARGRGIPWVVTPHGALAPACLERHAVRKKLALPVERRLLEGAAAVHLYFDPEHADIRRVAPNAEVITAPTGFGSTAQTWRGDGGYLAWLGRYDRQQKGLDLLASAVAMLSPAEPPRVILRGRDHNESRQDIERLMCHAGVQHYVTVGTSIEDQTEKEEFFARSLAFVQPSRWESNSIALLEALSAGVPCLVTRTCPISTLLEQHDAGVVVDATPRDIARGIDEVRTRGRTLSANARDLFLHDLAWTHVVPTFIGQLARLLACQGEEGP